MKLIGGMASLLAGATIYLLFRSKRLLGFELLSRIGAEPWADRMRSYTADVTLPDVVVYSLPGGLWSLGYILIIDSVFGHQTRSTRIVWASVIPLLGVGSDLKTQREASFFLPDSVRKDFDNIILTNPDGTKRKLVAKATWLIHPKKTIDQSPSTFVTPQIVFGILFAIILMLTIYQWRSQRSLWLLDTILLIATGLAGIILFIMIFSQHPTVRINLQILLLNPLSLIFAYHVAKAERKGLSHWYWRLLLAFLALFFIGGIFQDYAEGMCWLGLTMLTRSILSIKNQKPKTKN